MFAEGRLERLALGRDAGQVVAARHQVEHFAHAKVRVGVMQGGELVEELSAEDLRAGRTKHPHTADLRALTLNLEEPDL